MEKREFVHPQASHANKKKSTGSVTPINAFYAFLVANLMAALFSPIQDCDETFNYWEPTHYLSHGYGLQTWEYSPDYAIRSWLYIAMHAIVANLRRLLPRSNKVAEFYFVRYALAFICALCQTLMFRVINTTFNPRVGLFFVMALIFSPGNFHASTAYLPSSFAMYMAILGAAAFMNWRGGLRTSEGIFWFAMAAVIGWPFAAALSLPFLLEEAVLMLLGDQERRLQTIVRVGRGALWAGALVLIDTVANTFFYRKLALVPWNIIKYNILSSSGGPSLYGTEPWTFYFKNLALNFHIWFFLALSALPLFLLQKLFSASSQGFRSGLRTVVFLSPFYLWLVIFTMQPHKEERFMYPAYPFLALNAAVALHIIVMVVAWSSGKMPARKLSSSLSLLLLVVVVTLALNVGMLRIMGVLTGYRAPMSIYHTLNRLGRPGDSVCFGKDWYRFPSSFFLPRGMTAKFIQSDFHGLLPGEFANARTDSFFTRSGTWMPTTGFNDRNEEDPSKYVDLSTCRFLVDTQFPEQQQHSTLQWPPPTNEPDFVGDTEHWEVVKCLSFLDAASTPLIPRTLWIPSLPSIPAPFRRKWGRHCLLRQIAPAGAAGMQTRNE